MDITADELLNMFNTSIEQIGSREGICKFLDILSRNPKLDFMDAVNIYTQYPEGKMLDTYRGWDKNYGRHIKRWEKGIKSIDYTQEELIGDNGEIYDVRSVPKLINKYDISQTQGKSIKMFSQKRDIGNEQCQIRFRTLLSAIVKEQLEELQIPLNSLAGVCSKYVISKFYGVPDKEFDKHMERFSFTQKESVTYFLGELFEILERSYDKLINCYLNMITEFISTEPDTGTDLECVEGEKICDKDEVAVSIPIPVSDKIQDTFILKQEKTELNKAVHPNNMNAEHSKLKPNTQGKKLVIKDSKPIQPARESLLEKLKIKVAEAKIYNNERNI